jgi:hypothetical protein
MTSVNPNILADIVNSSILEQTITFEFNRNIHSNIFITHYNVLRDTSEDILFSSDSWTYNPKKLCIDYYNEYSLYPIVMLINNINSILLFKKDNFKDNLIKMPTYNKIFELISFR